jgi:hypothetical protein
MQPPPTPQPDSVEVSFVMPCLNEAETIERCVQAAFACIKAHNLSAEVVVGDNGSTDGSQELARRAGARVIPIPIRGYGAALNGAIHAARGRYIIMGDSDLQHDFAACYPFVEKLREGYQLVMGSRRLGKVMPGAMKWKNRYIGAPALSLVGRVLFRAPISDFHCGLRAFTKEAYQSLTIRTSGMEFASEHIIKSTLARHKMTDIPIIVYPEGRSRPPHLKPWRDGWRHLRFMLLLSPRWTFAVPGLVLMILGMLMSALVATGPRTMLGVPFDIHTLVLGCLFVLVGFTALTIGAAARIYAIVEELGPPAKYQRELFSIFTLERGLILGSLVLAAGTVLVGSLVFKALSVEIHPDEVSFTLRRMVIGSTLIALGAQIVLMSFFYSMLGIPRGPKAPAPPPA